MSPTRRLAFALVGLVDLACAAEPAGPGHGESIAEELEAANAHSASTTRLAEFEDQQRATIDFEHQPASDHRFGSDPVRLIALPERRFAGVLRGLDRLVVLDEFGAMQAELATPHLPMGLALAPDRATLVVVGIGEPLVQIVDLTIDEELQVGLRERDRIELGAEAMSPRDLAFAGDRLWIVDEGTQAIHALAWPPSDPPSVRSRPHCRGPIELRAIGDLLLTNCLIEHTLRIDSVGRDPGLIEQAMVGHDGPIWAFDGRVESDGDVLLALAGVEDHPLDRRDGGFGHVDSFVFLTRFDRATKTLVREAEINVSELGLVTPKSIAFGPRIGSQPAPDWTLDLTGYATAERLRLHGRAGELANVERHPWLPGSQSVLRVEHEGSITWLAANPLLDIWMLGAGDLAPGWVAVPDDRDDRSFPERLGEALLTTTAMAPDNSSEGQRSRFTCETCHFEGRGDGRTHWTGRGEVHATSKTLFGLFENRPYFSRALDKTMAVMVDSEFRVANRHSPRDPWATLTERDLPWLARLPGWPGEVDGELLRRSLMAGLIRASMPSNPRARARAAANQREFSPLEARGAELFRDQCESCHEARLVADDPSTRVPFGRWAALVLSETGPILWASDVYARTAIEPWVHELGARIPSLRRLHLDGPYFTTGAAASVSAVLAGVRVRSEARVDHDLPDSAGQPLAPADQQALLAFLDLL